MPKPAKPVFNADTVILSVVSDLHCGSTVGLCPPKVDLDDGGHYAQSKAQRWLWDGWHTYWESVEKKRNKAKADLIVVCNGDATDGHHHGTTQVLSGNPIAQMTVVAEVLRAPLALKPEALVFVRGTEAHVGPSASSEERIATGLLKDGRPVLTDSETGSASWWKWMALIQGVKLDFAHHGKIGTRPWTKMTAVYSAAYEIWTEYHMRGYDHPNLAIRSHMHRYADTFNASPTRLIQTAAWQLATAYVHKIAPNSLADIGALTITIRDGKYEVEPFFLTPAERPVWEIK